MFTFLLILLIIDALVLIPVVLLQAGKGGGLAAMGGGAGSDTLFGGRHATTLLTKLTWWAGGAFILLAFTLSLLSRRGETGESILQQEFQRGPAPVTAPAAGAVEIPGTRPAEDAAVPAPEGAALPPAEAPQP